jgi:hypothetical protein
VTVVQFASTADASSLPRYCSGGTLVTSNGATLIFPGCQRCRIGIQLTKARTGVTGRQHCRCANLSYDHDIFVMVAAMRWLHVGGCVVGLFKETPRVRLFIFHWTLVSGVDNQGNTSRGKENNTTPLPCIFRTRVAGAPAGCARYEAP